ncbi:hypothetical protein BT69DRAFT_210969 [Atractiella rhizophila]|nr:hypothetical protein BT69DRAFT_210969 [Atractiella rhizophila]
MLLFALFSIGNQRLRLDGSDLIPYKLWNANWLIPLVLVVYALVVAGEHILLLLVNRRYKKADFERRPMMNKDQNDSQYDLDLPVGH